MRLIRKFFVVLVVIWMGCQVKYSTLDSTAGKAKEISVGTPDGAWLGNVFGYRPYGLPYGYGPYGNMGQGMCQPLVTYPLGPDMPAHVVQRAWVYVEGWGYQCRPISL